MLVLYQPKSYRSWGGNILTEYDMLVLYKPKSYRGWGGNILTEYDMLVLYKPKSYRSWGGNILTEYDDDEKLSQIPTNFDKQHARTRTTPRAQTTPNEEQPRTVSSTRWKFVVKDVAMGEVSIRPFVFGRS
jgi:hypothetical protein